MGKPPAHNTMAVWGVPLALACAYGGLAAVSLTTAQLASGMAIVWPASGVLLAGLMLLQGRARYVLVGGVGIASLTANLAFGVSWTTAAGFTVANLMEGATAATIALGGNRAWGRFDDPIWVGRFFAAAVAAAAVGATIASLVLGGTAWPTFFGSWFSTVLLGMLIVTPALIMLHSGRFLLLFDRDTLYRALAVFVGGAAAIAVTFFQTRYSLLFLPLAVTVFATYLLGAAGAVGILLMVSIGGTTAMMQGFLPPGFEADPVGNLYMFQIYLLIVFASALPLATLLEKSRGQAEEIARRNMLLETAEAFANVGHWRYDIATDAIEWSDELFRIHGLDPHADHPRDLASGAIAPGEEQAAREAFRNAIKTGEPFDHKLHVRRADGELRYVHACGYVERVDDRSTAVFGVLKDITDHAEAMDKLHVARAHAEREARNALHLSETDQLTGAANRRKLLAVLRREMDAAEAGGGELAIIMLDVDHFKAINDTHGHGVGDMVLQKLAEVSRKCLRDQDLFGRLGGEEFLVILPGADAAMAGKVGERLREAVVLLGDDPELGLDTLTISLGVAVHQCGSDESFFLQAADAALYQSKAAGRNRLTVASASAA